MRVAAYTCPNCGRTVPDWYKSHVCLPPKKDFAHAAKIDPGVALAARLVGAGVVNTHEVMQLLDGQITYRQLDYWIRTGRITLSDPRHGSGVHRTFTPVEVDALRAYVTMHRDAQQYHRELVDGTVWRYLLQRMAKVPA